jgi:hypothetical protein
VRPAARLLARCAHLGAAGGLAGLARAAAAVAGVAEAATQAQRRLANGSARALAQVGRLNAEDDRT